MRILVDADGCPVVGLCVQAARSHNIKCLILCDTAHEIQHDGAETLVFSKGPDSVDFALVNLVYPGDIVVTQDYGLAAMCLARSAAVLNQNGQEYTHQNIDAMLDFRHTSKKIRNAGGRLKGPTKRSKEQDAAFLNALEKILLR